jgi:hypothetical protein
MQVLHIVTFLQKGVDSVKESFTIDTSTTERANTVETLHTSRHYTAHHHPKAGLIIQSTRKSGGIRLAPDHPQYGDYVDAIKTAIDASEADALCRALLN